MIRRLIPTVGEIPDAGGLESYYRLPGGVGHVRVNFVASLDGAVEVAGRSRPLGNDADRSAFMSMRAVADVIVVGAGTARAERYGPVKLAEEARQRRAERQQPELPRLALVTARADLDPAMRLFSGDQPPLLITTEWAVSERPDLADVAEVITCGSAHVDLHIARQELWSRGLYRVLCEGGPALFRSLLITDLVDELCLSLAPVLAGGEHRNLTADAPLPDLAEFRLDGLLESQSMLLCRYSRVRV